MLISFLMPTRNPLEWLQKAIDSILTTSSDVTQIEILLRIDDDDLERIQFAATLDARYVKTFVGPRGVGYLNMPKFVDDLAGISTGKWCWLFDDDCWIVGDTWQQQIEKIHCDANTGPAIRTEKYKLGGSLYRNVPDNPVGLIVPRGLCADRPNQNPVDRYWLDVINQRGWKVETLHGVTYCHEGRPR